LSTYFRTSQLLSPQLEVTTAFPLHLYPNPANERLFLQLSLPAAKRVLVEVQDALGRRIATAAYDGAPGEQAFELPTAGWAPGLYWVSVVVDGVRVVEMVEKV
jgi:hypothetical protein